VIAIIFTLKDKNAAQKRKWRIEERTLLIISALGGSVAMLFTMRLIRHKTKHKKFMIGIPVLIILQIAVVGVIIYLRQKGAFT
jgi:uncharacterized membrane protein YsdA (DUF1294 family)